MGKLDLTLHPDKTKVVCLWDGKEGFDFLGMHHRRFNKTRKDGRPYGELCQYPCKKAMKKIKRILKENINSRSLLVLSEDDLIKAINPKIIGWRNYYKTKTDTKWMHALDWYIICTFARWYNKKHQGRRHLSQMKRVRTILKEKGLQKLSA